MGNRRANLLAVVIETDHVPALTTGVVDTPDAAGHLASQSASAIDGDIAHVMLAMGRARVAAGGIARYHAARVAIGHHAVGDVVQHDTAGADDAPPPDFHARDHDCRRTDPGSLADVDIAAQRGLGRDVDIVAQAALVVDCRTRVDNAVPPHPRVALDDGTLHDDRALADSGKGRHHGRRVLGRDEFTPQPLGDLLAVDIIADAHQHRRLPVPLVQNGYG